jgi:Holliday junction resolvasome RuvABC endonuclease subunit
VSAHVLGLDLSLSSTGAAAIDDTGRVDTWVKTTEPVTGHDIRDVDARLSTIARWVMGRCTTGTRLAVIEGPAMGAKFGRPDEIGGLRWRVIRGLIVREIPIAVIAPKRMKWFVTGTGNADKPLIRRTVAKLWPGQGLDRVTFDEADAVGLAGMGVCWLGWDGPWFDARSLAIETGAQWPERESVTA